MRAAALVLLRALFAVFVRADRHVLCAVIFRELGAAEREKRRREREQARRQLLRCRAQARPAHDANGDRVDEVTDNR